jgi:hypothetical protein
MESEEQLRRWSENARAFYRRHLSRELALQQYLDLTRTAIAKGVR